MAKVAVDTEFPDGPVSAEVVDAYLHIGTGRVGALDGPSVVCISVLDKGEDADLGATHSTAMVKDWSEMQVIMETMYKQATRAWGAPDAFFTK